MSKQVRIRCVQEVLVTFEDEDQLVEYLREKWVDYSPYATNQECVRVEGVEDSLFIKQEAVK
jgi:hypothetical protein